MALLALIGAVVAWAVSSGNGSDETTVTTQASIPQAAPPQQAHKKPRLGRSDRQAHTKPRLRLSGRGQPIVWLRHGARIPIRTAPGGKVVKTPRLADAIRLADGAGGVSPPRRVGGRAHASLAQRPSSAG